MKQDGRPSVAVLGAGLIGVDLASKAIRTDVLDFQLVVGRDERTPGLRQAARMGLGTSAEGIRALTEAAEPFDIVFDATNAMSHARHAELLAPRGTMLIDLTPSKVGQMVVPTVNGLDAIGVRDVNMVSCGGQAAIPLLHAVSRRHRLDYVEVVTTAASLSVGRSTRLNLDEYVQTTQDAVRDFTGAKEVKAILNISPARPPATFRVAMYLHGDQLTQDSVAAAVEEAAAGVRAFVGGYRVTACTVNDGTAFVAVEVTARSDHIPKHAGNIDIINSAALHVAEQYALSNRPDVEKESA